MNDTINPSLKNIRQALEILGNPQDEYLSIQIAGTNGKGFVCSFLEQAFLQQKPNLSIGRYISPHLLSVTERISVNGIDISEQRFYELYKDLFAKEYSEDSFQKEAIIDPSAKLRGVELTYFERLTAIAFYYFKQEGIDLAILETGLGGRWDATNVINPEKALATAITNVSMDHMEYLGDTVEKIRAEKEGIKKTGVAHFEGYDWDTEDAAIDPNSLHGCNTKLAAEIFEKITKVKLNSYQREKVLEKVNQRYLARFDWDENSQTLIDAAHNPAAALKLKQFIRNLDDARRIYLIAMLDKDYKNYIENLFKNLINNEDIIVFTETKSNRDSSSKELSEYCKSKFSCNQIENFADNKEAFEFVKDIKKTDDQIIVSGSIVHCANYLNWLRQQKKSQAELN